MRFTEFLLNEVYDEQRGRPLSREEMRDRIINLLRSDDDAVLDHTLEILATVGIDDTMDVPQMEHILMSLDMGDDRDNRKLARLYQQLEHMVDLDY